MKTRIQIQVDPQDHEALKSWAKWRGASVSAVVRWLIREKLAAEGRRTDAQRERFLSVAGAVAGAADEGEVSARHDRYLYGQRGAGT
jgi:hypothetical protein